MTQANLFPTQKKIEAFTAAMLWALAWLVGVMTKLGAPRRSRMLLRAVRYCEDRVECILFLQAARLCGLRRRGCAPRTAPHPGFRHARPNPRLFLRCANIRAPRGATFQERVERLCDALAKPELFIARFAKRLRRGLHGAVIVIAAPVEDSFAAAPAAAPAFANSS